MYYFLRRLRDLLPQLEALRWTDLVLPLSGTIALVLVQYALGLLAWRQILAALGQPLPTRPAATVFLLAQFAKYVPGNIAHQVGRVVLATRQGVAATTASLSLVLELLLLIAGSLAVASPFLLTRGHEVLMEARQEGLSLSIWIAGALAACAVLLLPAALRLIGRRYAAVLPSAVENAGACLWRAFALMTAASFVLGLSLWWLGQNLFADKPLVAVVPLVPLCFVAGLLTPGAPAGLGVREALLLTLLSPVYGSPQAAIISVLFRVASMIADLIGFGLGVILRAQQPDRRRS
jgi:uncharacterized membrane protein YbhN (UPF0104 family)